MRRRIVETDSMQVTIEGVLCEVEDRGTADQYRVCVRDAQRSIIFFVDKETGARLARMMFRRVTVLVEGDPDGDVCFPPDRDEEIP